MVGRSCLLSLDTFPGGCCALWPGPRTLCSRGLLRWATACLFQSQSEQIRRRRFGAQGHRPRCSRASCRLGLGVCSVLDPPCPLFGLPPTPDCRIPQRIQSTDLAWGPFHNRSSLGVDGLLARAEVPAPEQSICVCWAARFCAAPVAVGLKPMKSHQTHTGYFTSGWARWRPCGGRRRDAASEDVTVLDACSPASGT